MAITPEIDAIVAKIGTRQSLLDALDGVQPITVSIGTFSLTVDPTVNLEAYNRGAEVLKLVAQGEIAYLRGAIATVALAASAPA